MQAQRGMPVVLRAVVVAGEGCEQLAPAGADVEDARHSRRPGPAGPALRQDAGAGVCGGAEVPGGPLGTPVEAGRAVQGVAPGDVPGPARAGPAASPARSAQDDDHVGDGEEEPPLVGVAAQTLDPFGGARARVPGRP